MRSSSVSLVQRCNHGPTRKTTMLVVAMTGAAALFALITSLRDARPMTFIWKQTQLPAPASADKNKGWPLSTFGLDHESVAKMTVDSAIRAHFMRDPQEARRQRALQPSATVPNFARLPAAVSPAVGMVALIPDDATAREVPAAVIPSAMPVQSALPSAPAIEQQQQSWPSDQIVFDITDLEPQADQPMPSTSVIPSQNIQGKGAEPAMKPSSILPGTPVSVPRQVLSAAAANPGLHKLAANTVSPPPSPAAAETQAIQASTVSTAITPSVEPQHLASCDNATVCPYGAAVTAYGFCPGDGNFAAMVAYDLRHHETGGGAKITMAVEVARQESAVEAALINDPECSRVLTSLKSSVPGFSFKTVADVRREISVHLSSSFGLRFDSHVQALKILSNKRIVLVGDSLTRGAFRDVCQWLGGTSPLGKMQSDLWCEPSVQMRQFGVQLSSRWIPYFESKFTAANFTNLMITADVAVISTGSWFARYHHYHTQNKTLSSRIRTLQRQAATDPKSLPLLQRLQLEQQRQRDGEDSVASTPDGAARLLSKQLTEYGLEGYKLLFESVAKLPIDARKPVFIIRSPSAFGTPTVPPSMTGTFQNFRQYNKIVVAIGEWMQSIMANPKYADIVSSGWIRFVDGTSYSFDPRTNLRTTCPLFTGSKEPCACHMNDQLGWRSLNQQLLNVLCSAPTRPRPPTLNKEAMGLITKFHARAVDSVRNSIMFANVTQMQHFVPAGPASTIKWVSSESHDEKDSSKHLLNLAAVMAADASVQQSQLTVDPVTTTVGHRSGSFHSTPHGGVD